MLVQQAAQVSQVPSKVQLLVKETLWRIGAVQRWIHSECLPKLALMQLVSITTCHVAQACDTLKGFC